MRRGIEKRLEFIEFRLFWEGVINRSDIIAQFRISTPQASNDLSRYEEHAPGNMLYDSSRKCYVASENFQPRFTAPNADQYLTQLRTVTEHTHQLTETWLSCVPFTDAMPIPQRRVDGQVLRAVLGAIRTRSKISILYQSMNEERPEPVWRWLSPHALANDGLRWHVRGFCHVQQKFKDFLLSRCLASAETQATEVAPDTDMLWNSYFGLILVPNPVLSSAQQAVIAQDYRMEYGQLAVSVRKALLYYFNKRLRLDVAKAIDDPRETPIVVHNQKAFTDALSEVG